MTRAEIESLLDSAVWVLRRSDPHVEIPPDLARYIQAHKLREEATSLRTRLEAVEHELKWAGLSELPEVADDA